MVRPRGMGGVGTGAGGTGVGGEVGGWLEGRDEEGGRRERWDLDGLKKDKVDVNTCKFALLSCFPLLPSYREPLSILQVTLIHGMGGRSHQEHPSRRGRRRSGRFQTSAFGSESIEC